MNNLQIITLNIHELGCEKIYTYNKHEALHKKLGRVLKLKQAR